MTGPPDGSPSPRRWCASWPHQYTERDGERQRSDRRLLRHLRPRQRRRARPGAAGRPDRRPLPLPPGPQRAGDGARRGRLRPRCATGWRRFACTTSIGPGATNMVTGAALATINRLPVLLLPGDIFATRAADPVLQQLEDPARATTSRSTTLPPGVALLRPDQPPRAAVPPRCWRRCACSPTRPRPARSRSRCPQDVQAEAFDWPGGVLRRRVWHVRRPAARAGRARRAPPSCCAAPARPLIVAGGGVIYAEATDALRALAEATGIPVAETQAGKGALPLRPPAARSARSAPPARPRPTRWPARPTWCIGVGTRWSDFTTASRTAVRGPGRALRQPQRRAPSTRPSTPGCRWSADARVGARRAARGAGRLARSPPEYRQRRARAGRRVGRRRSTRRVRPRPRARCPPRARSSARSTTVSRARATSWSAPPARCPATCTSCGAPATRKGYHVEYGYSCMGYEIAGGLGVKLAGARAARCSCWSATART